ncbi:hypothetical protein BD410DRAFT_881418 [Rickenella mellea]|uniref:F-box domain-containing protein n=1 Tax=Rickenella mellea TaxID=50990 RepID=A0A4Y7PS38_9AGAM|nr:hypothetical protein BD410DRAFT_881418 [Rickenella mellea]
MDPYFPPYIWRRVFSFAVFTATCLNAMDWDPNWPRFGSSTIPDSSLSYKRTLRTKKALTLVSRHFHEMSLEFMFELVQICYIRHAELLADILRSHPSSPGKWIKNLLVSLDGAAYCENLTAFGWESHVWYRRDLDREEDRRMSEDLIKSIPLGISVLRWSRPSFRNFFTSLRHHSALRQLCISMISAPDDLLITLPSVTHLETQDIQAWGIVRRWELPSISHLNVNWYGPWQVGDEERYGFDPHDVERFPDSIRHFSIQISHIAPFRVTSFLPLVAPFRELETFSYTLDFSDESRNPNWIGVHHPTLQHVGIRCRTAPMPWTFVTRWGDFMTKHIN